MTATPPRLGTGTKLSYAVGNVGLQMLVAAMSFLLMIFYTDVALVPPAIAGAALLVGKFWDAVNDPLLGWMSDRTRSRHGRHRVYLLYGALPLALAAAAAERNDHDIRIIQIFVIAGVDLGCGFDLFASGRKRSGHWQDQTNLELLLGMCASTSNHHGCSGNAVQKNTFLHRCLPLQW